MYMKGIRKDPELLQVSLEKLTGELMMERQPILLEDSLVDAERSLLDTVFKRQYIKMDPHGPIAAGQPMRCRARYTLITCTCSNQVTNLRLTHEARPGVGVDIVMASGQSLIMPPGWLVTAHAEGCNAVSLHDLFTFFWQ